MSKRAEFWLWWFTDESGRRRRTSFRMSRDDAVKRYPDAEPIAAAYLLTLSLTGLSGDQRRRLWAFVRRVESGAAGEHGG